MCSHCGGMCTDYLETDSCFHECYPCDDGNHGTDECENGHDSREGKTSMDRCYAMAGCGYDEASDHCYNSTTTNECGWAEEWRLSDDGTWEGC